MDFEERIKMVKAMEYVARQINNTDILWEWISHGVADEDIQYGDFNTDAKDLHFCSERGYIDDRGFSRLMREFLWCMKEAYNDGGLFCDWVVSE